MFSQDEVSVGQGSNNASHSSITLNHSKNASRSSNNARASFKNPYMDMEKVSPPTNNTSGIKSSVYSSGVKYNEGIKTYEQKIVNDGQYDEPLYTKIEKTPGSHHFSSIKNVEKNVERSRKN